MADIFVSYSRQNEAFGRKLHARLTGIKREVWMDWEDIPFNSDWWEEIKRGIETSDNFLIILTQDFVSSPVCMLEVDYARQNNKRILIISHNFKETNNNSSLLLQRTKESETIQRLLNQRDIVIISRENWRSIGHVNWLFFNHDDTFDTDFRNLIETLDTDLEHVRSHTALQVRALDWYENDKNWSFLLTGVQIDQAEKWLEISIGEAKSPQPTAIHSDFIKASRARQNEQEQDIKEMQTRAKRFRQVSIVAGVIATVMIIVGISLTIFTGNLARNAQDKLAIADTQIGEAEDQVGTADEQAAGANTQAVAAGETLTSIPPTFAAIQLEIDTNNTQVASVGETLTPIGATLAFAESAREDAQNLANNAQTQVFDASMALNEANESLTPVAVTLTHSAEQQALADAQVATANADSMTAEAQLLDANNASTESAAQLATSAIQIRDVSTEFAESNLLIADANAILTQVVPTLTQASDLVVGANTQVADAETQVAGANHQIATADVQNHNLQGTAIAIQQIAEINQIQAQSQSLIVNAEQAALNGDIDLALALLLESYELNDNLPQTRRLLNDIAYTSARFILPDASFVTFNSASTMVAYGDGNDVVVLDIASRDEITRLQGHSDTVVAGDFNFEDNLFVSGSRDSNVLVWNTRTWEIERSLDYGVAISDVRFDNQGNRIGAVGDKSELIVWNLQNNYSPLVISFDNPETVLTELHFYGNGSRVLALGHEALDEVQYRVNLSNGGFARDLEGIYTTINPAYDVLAGHTPRSAMIDTEFFLTIYDMVDRSETAFGTGFFWQPGGDVVGERAFDSTGSQIIVALSNQSQATSDLILFNIGQRERSSGLEFEGEGTERVTALAYSPDGRTILSGFGRYLILWDIQTGRELRRFGTHLDDIIEISYSLDSNHAITQSRDGSYRVWDVSFSDPAVIGQVSVVSSLAESVTNPGLSPDGTEIYFNRASEIFRMDTKTGNPNQTAFSYSGIQDILYSRVNTYIVTTTTTNSVAMMWDASLPSNEVQVWNDPIRSADGETIDPVGAFSSDGQQLALSMSDFVHIYNLTSVFNPELIVRFDRSGMEIGALVFSPDGRYLYAAINQLEEEAYAIVRWSINTEEVEIVPIPHIRAITSMDIRDDGRQIITASLDGTVVLFDLENQSIVRRMVGHQSPVNEVYFGLNDNVALSASDDGSLILWDLVTGQSIRRFVTGNPISGLYLSNDSTIAISTEGTNLVTVWRIESLDDVIEWVRDNRAILPLTAEECQQFEVDCDSDDNDDDDD